MTDKARIKAKRRPYKKPEVEKVRLVPEEAVLTGCKTAHLSGPGDPGGCNPQGHPKCATPQS